MYTSYTQTVLALLKTTSRTLNNNTTAVDYPLSFLGQYVLLTILGRGKRLRERPPGMPEHPRHSFLAGLVGGYAVWGRYSSVNFQIVLYLFSRIVAGLVSLAKLQLLEGGDDNSNNHVVSSSSIRQRRRRWFDFDTSYPLLAAGVWGTVMALFETYPHVLASSLRRSMDDVYR